MQIDGLTLKNNIFLAPMAGITDPPFRKICFDFGLSFAYTEMINAKALIYEDKTTLKMLKKFEGEGDLGVQIFGNDPDIIGKAVKIIEELERFVLIDINMGCPAPKITKNKEGCALMKNPELSNEIVCSAVKNTKLPVTVKLRIGWDSNSINVISMSKGIEESGASSISIHGRTREQYYSGEADWNIISNVKKNISIPVIGNGDIQSIEEAKEKINKYGVDAVLIGRACRGNPFLFSETNKEDITLELLYKTILEHYNLAIEYLGEERAVIEMRKHIGWYVKGLTSAAKIRNEINKLKDFESINRCLNLYFTQF